VLGAPRVNLHDKAGRAMQHFNGWVGDIAVLAASSGAAFGFDAEIFIADNHLHIVCFIEHSHGRRGSMPPPTLVVGRNPLDTVDANEGLHLWDICVNRYFNGAASPGRDRGRHLMASANRRDDRCQFWCECFSIAAALSGSYLDDTGGRSAKDSPGLRVPPSTLVLSHLVSFDSVLAAEAELHLPHFIVLLANLCRLITAVLVGLRLWMHQDLLAVHPPFLRPVWIGNCRTVLTVALAVLVPNLGPVGVRFRWSTFPVELAI